MKSRFLIITIFYFVLLSHSFAQYDEFLFRKISPPEGFTYGSIKTIAQDENGFIWFGTEHGLYRYNTQDVEIFIHQKDDPNSLPNDNILNIFKDRNGILWVVTNDGLCFFNEEKQNFSKININDVSKNNLNSSILSVHENKGNKLYSLHLNHFCELNIKDSIFNVLPLHLIDQKDFLTHAYFDNNDILWIGTNKGYIYQSKAPYQSFKVFFNLRTEPVQTICQDNNTIWIGYEWGGADHVNEHGLLINHYNQKKQDQNYIPHNRVRKIIKDPENRIWIGTYDGLAIVTKNNTQIVTKNYYNNLPANSIYDIFTDFNNGIWIGTWSGGLAFLSKYDNQFLHFNKNPGPNSLSSNVVSSFSEEKNGTIWISTEDGILNKFDKNTKTFVPFNLKSIQTGTSNIKCLSFDKDDRLWIGTLSSGLWHFDINSNKFIHHNIFDSDIINVYSILPVDDGLWLGTYGNGLFFYDTNTKKVKKYESDILNPNTISSNSIRTIIKDSYGGIWIGTQTGLNYLAKGSNRFMRYFYNKNESQRISNNEVFALYEDISGKIWIGTGGGGVDYYNPETGIFQNLSPKQGLSGNNVYGILEDKNGNIWFSTENGLSCYLIREGKFKNYYKEDGLQGNQFIPGAAYKCRNGEFLFGGPNGFNLINPESITENPMLPVVIITSLIINNLNVRSNDSINFNKNSINTLKEIELLHWQNSLTFEFVANNFIQPKKNEFRYRLVNYQNEWIDAKAVGKAIFTKIPPGNYVFEIMCSNNDGLWNETPTQLNIKIKSPFWKTSFAYAFYLIFVLIIIWILQREYLYRHQLKNQLVFEKLKRESDDNFHQLKMQIFTNISHEFRTPLTLILSPLESILNDTNLSIDIRNNLLIVQRNAQRLRMLINQIIDFRKFELKKMELQKINSDIIKLCTDVCNNFEFHAKDKSIDYKLETSLLKYETQVDPDKFEKIIFNLLSNSFKYTPDGGKINVTIEETEITEIPTHVFSTNQNITGKVISFRFLDNGPGIEESELPQVFERFYRGNHGKLHGTGIGLHLCCEYAKLHDGAILVKSNINEGSEFSFLLPVSNPNNIVVAKDTLSLNLVKESDKIIDETSKSSDTNKDNYSILIVEDNNDMQKQLKKLLSDHYKVISSSNGNHGLELAQSIFPDIVISDVMMPGMDGFELCKKLKEDIQTSHIPVILLTALSEVDMQIDGLENGADAYIIKPFENRLLFAQINNLLNSKKRLQQTFKESEEKWAKDSNLMNRDKNLIERAFQIVEKHLLDPNFSIEDLAMEMGLSRSSLHRKMRILTNQSATEFVRYVRMKKAVKMMKEGSFNVDEIGFAVGFNSHSYFTQCFKKQYGKTPTEYIYDFKSNANKP